jgi:hypothetical protein
MSYPGIVLKSLIYFKLSNCIWFLILEMTSNLLPNLKLWQVLIKLWTYVTRYCHCLTALYSQTSTNRHQCKLWDTVPRVSTYGRLDYICT